MRLRKLLNAVVFIAFTTGLSAAQPSDPRAALICANCHPEQAKAQPATSMAHALESVAECNILREHPLLTFTEGGFSYRIERQGQSSIYTVSDGQNSVSLPLGWAFGLGVAGQTYVFEKDGALYQSRVSFYREINGLDLTLGVGNHKATTLSDAIGMKMDEKAQVDCFDCHATNAAAGRHLTLDHATLGVQCERCHGPAENHLAAVLHGGDSKLGQMEHLKARSTEQISNFCGQCHRTWEQIALQGRLGVADVRFQPYRLTNSKCYDADDARISCLACHDPHQEINRVDASYDGKCEACHAGEKAKAKACPRATANCVSCHMPKILLPGSHHKFTDHQIRIVRANEAYPD